MALDIRTALMSCRAELYHLSILDFGMLTRSSAVAERLRDARCPWKFC